jgi:hypothetical protein
LSGSAVAARLRVESDEATTPPTIPSEKSRLFTTNLLNQPFPTELTRHSSRTLHPADPKNLGCPFPSCEFEIEALQILILAVLWKIGAPWLIAAALKRLKFFETSEV